MTKEGVLSEVARTYYLTTEDVEFMVSNGERNDLKFSHYFDAAYGAIALNKFHHNNPVGDQKQFAKFLFNWIRNYNRNLKGSAEQFAAIVYEVFYDQRIPSVIKGRKEIEALIAHENHH